MVDRDGQNGNVTREEEQMNIIDGIPVWGDPVDDGALRQIKNCAKTAERVAMMADHHKGYAVPIGGVVAYSNSISPSGVGYDIACGNKAVLTNLRAEDIQKDIERVMDLIWNGLSFGMGRRNETTTVDHALFDDDTWKLRAVASLKEMARHQLGTIGGGNHYVDLFSDESGYLWIGVHFGSRGLGHKTATYFLKEGGAKDGIDVDPLVIPVSSPLGSDYLACMELAGRYAYAGRDWVCAEVARLLGAAIVDEVHNHHNYAWREIHDSEHLWVVRKGATPAFPGQKGFIGGSMGDNAVIVEGVENDEAKYSMYSTVHGAGRVMSRTAARGKINRKTGEIISTGAISREMMNEWIRGQGVTLRGAGTDESPHAYKRLPEVLAHHSTSVKILHTLKPIGVAMAGENEIDPFKD